MGQKVNPISLRLQQTNRQFDNSWYTQYFYRKLVSRDIYLQQYINSFLKHLQWPSARFSIQYSTKNIKLWSFLCYPKQSRELRSRIFGRVFSKKRKYKVKSKTGIFAGFLSSSDLIGFTELRSLKPTTPVNFEPKYSNALQTKKIQNQKYNYPTRRSKLTMLTLNQKLKFLGDNRLWSRVYYPSHHIKKNGDTQLNGGSTSLTNGGQDNIIIQKKKQANILKQTRESISLNNMSTSLVLNTYANNTLSRFNNYINKPGYFLLPYMSREFLYKTKYSKNPLVSIAYSFKKEMEYQNKTIKNNQQILSFGPSPKDTANNLSFLSCKKQNIVQNQKQYKKDKKDTCNLLDFIKNFVTTLFFIKILRINQYNKSKLSHPFVFSVKKNSALFKINEKYSLNFNTEYRKNFLKFFLVFSLLYTEYNTNTVYNSMHRTSEKQLNTRNGENSLHYFSPFLFKINLGLIFNPISNFHSIIQNNTPFNFLLQKNSDSFWSLKKNSNVLTINNLGLDSRYFQKIDKRFEIIPNLYNTVKKHQIQELKYKNYIQHFLTSQFNINTEFVPFGVLQDWQSAGFLADEIVYFLERRVTFRRLKNKILKKITPFSNIRGIRISCSGRVGGKSKKAQRAKTECVKYGQTSRHTFSSRIDFAARTARTIFGSVGIKVWICYN